FDTIFRAAPIGLAFLDRELRYFHVNRVLAEMNGMPMEDHFGRSLEHVIPALAPKLRPILEKVLRTQEPVVKLEMWASVDGKTNNRCVLINYYPVRIKSEILGIGCAIVDITDLKIAEGELKKRALELEASNHELEQYAHIASHDLQEPLRMVSLFV